MKILIVGAGRVGGTIVELLANEDHDITVVDLVKNNLSLLSVKYDVNAVLGNGTDVDVLKEAKAESADLFIACTAKDELNVLCCLIAKKLGVTRTVARIRSPEYCDLFKENDLGINLIINPEYESARELFRALRFPSALRVEPFVDGKVDIFEFRIGKNNPLINTYLSELNSKYGINVLVCAINRSGKALVPTGNCELLEGDIIYVTATLKNAEAFFKKLKIWKKSLKHIMICGGGRTTYYLCSMFKRMGNEIKIVEPNKKRCQALVQDFPKVGVVNADTSDYELLCDEGFAETDAFLSLTDDSSENAILCLIAKNLGVPAVSTIEEQPMVADMLSSQGITLISQKYAAASQIVRYVRGQSNAMGGAIQALYRIINGEAEILEFNVEGTYKALGQSLKEVNLIPNTLIAAILRNNEVIIPNGDDCILEGDEVLIVSKGVKIDELNDIVS